MEHEKKIKQLSTKEREVLDQVAINRGSGHSLAICQKLSEMSLIEQSGIEVIGKDAFGTIEVPFWSMPIDVHIVWCEVCSKETEEK